MKEYTDSEMLAKLFDIAAVLQFNKAKALALFKKEFMGIETAADPKMRPIDNDHIDSLFTVEDFRQMCATGALTDYDGRGLYATATQRSDIKINPSDCKNGTMDLILDDYPQFTHIIWYNK